MNKGAQAQIVELDATAISYFDQHPEGEMRGTVLLLHGFASTARVNWITTGWASTLLDAGYRIIAPDHRGHGESRKFYDPTDYGPDIFAADAVRLLDHCGVEHADVLGYSMGARVTAWLCHAHPERVRRAVFGGMGEHIFGGRGGYETIAEALEADDPATAANPHAASFRAFADRVGADRLALAACIRPSQKRITPELVAEIETRVLVCVGGDDEIAGSAEKLAAMMPNATAHTMPGLDHMRATGAPPFKARVLEFLDA